MKKRKLKKKYLIILILIFAILVIFATIKIITRPRSPKIVGSWTTDGITVYTFNKDNTGLLSVSLTDYEFTYKIEENKLYIDFENERSVDSTYEFNLDGDKLTLKGERGTFLFTKKEKH